MSNAVIIQAFARPENLRVRQNPQIALSDLLRDRRFPVAAVRTGARRPVARIRRHGRDRHDNAAAGDGFDFAEIEFTHIRSGA